MTRMRYLEKACACCGNSTIMFASGICETCIAVPPMKANRTWELAFIYIAAVVCIIGFVAAILSTHVHVRGAVHDGAGFRITSQER